MKYGQMCSAFETTETVLPEQIQFILRAFFSYERNSTNNRYHLTILLIPDGNEEGETATEACVCVIMVHTHRTWW
jgi:hypothetical protein